MMNSSNSSTFSLKDLDALRKQIEEAEALRDKRVFYFRGTLADLKASLRASGGELIEVGPWTGHIGSHPVPGMPISLLSGLEIRDCYGGFLIGDSRDLDRASQGLIASIPPPPI